MHGRESAAAVLDANRRDGYTIPSATLYPFQWNWDSAFVAVGLAHADPAAAKREIRTLLDARWENGMVPQIAFWSDAAGYFPGPDEWRVGTDRTVHADVETSGITQPPMVVPAAAYVYEATGDEAFRDSVLPDLEAYCEWWLRERSDDGELVWVRHPWATGMDDSPAWVGPLERFDPGEMTYTREDRKDSELAEQRPTDWDYDRYVSLVRRGRDLDWDETRLREESPFVVEDVLTNALFVRACESVAALSADAGDETSAERWRAQAETTRRALSERRFDDDLGLFVSYDLVADEPLPARSIAGLLPTLAGAPTDAQFARMRETLDEFLAYEYAAPSYVGPEMDYDRYWRGPVWLNTNWLLERGLRRMGAETEADRIRDDSRRLLDREGFREYFNPETGAGRGSDRFSWSAALSLAWAAEDAPEVRG
ncbi:MGH1-like glycoside hydrolase domain-containing protein [Halogeometricum luteum]|uniref:Glycoside hydrolase n=1 Tax=Halogeometricum luteum TaxID=2950537 RepID=A0ABU2G0D7_9EURY|nr:trehalase family glycosidase [Halogeometricum sp. S3BR5-2]MDS0293764.1 glycoside hydrolase [Halogeometricum sp. S3BR5-2]